MSQQNQTSEARRCQSTSGFKRPKCFKVVRTAPEGATPYEHSYSRRECYALDAESAIANICAETGWRPEECDVTEVQP